MKIGLYSLCIGLLVVCSCKKEEEVNENAPTLKFVSLSPESVVELKESMVLTLQYSDNDGDLGENVAGVENLFVKDSRTDVVYSYRVKQLAPDNSSIAIQGTLAVSINPLLISSGTSTEQGVFTAYIVDRAGNRSNTTISAPFTINQP